MSWVGQSHRRLEDPALLRGEGRFTADLPAALHARFVRSPLGSGTVQQVTAGPGTRVFTAADLADVKPIRPVLDRFGYVPVEQPVLATTVRYVGDPVAVAVAATAELAEDAAEAVLLDIAGGPVVTTVRAALAAGAPDVHAAAPGNVVVRAETRTPGFDAAMAASHRQLRCRVRSNRQSGQPIEPRAAHAAYDRATGRTVLTCTAQMPHLMRTAVADLLGMAESELRVVAPDVGGGFGQKMSLAPEYVVLVWLARRLRSSVLWVEDRRENLMASFHSRDMEVEVTGGFDADGRLLALEGDVLVNVGAYAPYPNTAAVEPLMSFAELPGPYDVQHYACVSRGVLTHTCTSAPYRGVARPAITLAMERLMDRAAASFGLPPEEIRRRNLIQRFPYVSATGLTYDAATYLETMEVAVRAADLPAFRARQAAARSQGRLLGVGMSTFCERTGYGTPAFAARGMGVTPGWETVEVSMDPSGFVEARVGASPHGQGLRTTLAQIIADEVGVRPDQVRIVHGDTDRTPYGWGTFASRSLVISGGACKLAARRVGDKLLALAAHLLEAAPGDIELADGMARVAGTDRSLPIPTLARTSYHAAHRLPGLPGLSEAASYDPAGTFSNACHIAFVAVDPLTYQVTVERFIVAEDAGRLINPMIVDGQIAGGVVQGIANALLEEIVYDPGGDITTTTLADFLLPTATDVPDIEIHHLETTSPETVTGAKGLGEGGTIGAPAAVLNAIADALGMSVDEMPATPLRLHTLMARPCRT